MDTQLVTRFLARHSGQRPWIVFETNALGFVDIDRKVHICGHMEDPQDADAMVELLNGGASLLSDHETLAQVPSASGVRVALTAESVVSELRQLRDALREGLQRWPVDDPRRAQLLQLCR